MVRASYILAGAVVLVAAPSRSALASDDVAHLTWEQLVQLASDASNKGNHQEALAWAQKASAIRLSPSLRVFLIAEQRAVGDAASAYVNAKVCVAEAETDSRLPMRDQIVLACRQAVAATESAIGQLAITLPSSLPPGTQVNVNGQNVAPAVLSLPYPVNVGTATVDVTAPGYAPFHEEVPIAAKAIVTLTVPLQPQEVKCPLGQVLGPDRASCVDMCPVGKAATTDGAHCCWPAQTWSEAQNTCAGTPQCAGALVSRGSDCVVASTATAVSATQQAPLPQHAAHGALPWLVGGVGALIAVGGTVSWLVSDSQFSSLKAACTSATGCTRSNYNSSASTVRTLDAVSYAGWAVGGATLVGGVIWWALGVETRGPTPSVGVHLYVDPSARSVSLDGVF
jgi:hypothetical protein